MGNRFITQLFLVVLLCIGINLSSMMHCDGYYHSERISRSAHYNYKLGRYTATHLHFYYYDIHTGENPSALVVARANDTSGDVQKKLSSPFGTVYAADNILREGPDETSEVVGNAQGLYVSSSQGDKVVLVMYMDFAFTTGEFNGSSFSVLSRNPVTEPTRELAVVGGRGKFRMASGFAEIRAHFLNVTTGDGIIEYDVTLFHY